MEKLISIILGFILTLRVEMVLGAENETFEASDEVISEEYYDVFAEEIETSEEVQLACSSKCVLMGEDCSRFRYRAAHKLCTVTKLKREKSGSDSGPIMRYFLRKSVREEKPVSPLLTPQRPRNARK